MSAAATSKFVLQEGQAPAAEKVRTRLDSALKDSHLPMLDGVRAIAVLMVILYHFGFESSGGAAGVLVFFVLSGFLITWLLLKESERSGDVSIWGFYQRRALRIFPAFYAYWFFALAIELVRGRAVPWAHALSGFFYFSNYYGALVHPPPSFVSHTWSLAVEEQYYLIWPCIFWLWRKDLRRLSCVVSGLIGLVWVHRAILHFVIHVDQGYIYRSFDTRFDHLLVGCLLAIILRAGFLARLWTILSGSVVVPFVTVGMLVLSISIGVISTMYRNVIGFAIEPILVAIVLVQLFVYRKSLLCSWLNSPIPVYLGTISYSLYLYQELTLFTARRLTAQYPVWIQFAVAVLSTVVMASASYWIIEKPFLRLKDRLTAPRETTKPQVVWSVESC